MATTVTTSYELIKRDPSTGRVHGGDYASSSPAECSQRASLNGVGDYISGWQTLAWKKATADGFWADPMYVAQGSEDSDAPIAYDVYVMRKVVTIVDESDRQSTETRYESVTA